MRVVHIAYIYGANGTGGAAIASTRLHNALLNAGIDSHYICQFAMEDGINVHVLPIGKCSRWLFMALGKLTRFMWRFTSCRASLEANILPLFGFERVLEKIHPDIVHAHWLNRGVISFGQLARIRYPVVLSLHDLFMVNILLPHPGPDKRYIKGLTQENSQCWERQLFYRKLQAVQKSRAVFIGPSEWICRCAKESLIGRQHAVYHVPNIIDTAFYYKEVKRRSEVFIMVFGAHNGRKNQYKGFEDLQKALALLPSEMKAKCALWIFGEDGEDTLTDGINTHFCGVITKADDLVSVYRQADVFLLPSRLDNAPSTKFEALLCGLPVIAFDRAGCAECIRHRESGWIAKDGDVAGFAEGIMFFYRQFSRGELKDIRPHIAHKARQEFSETSVIERTREIYLSCVNQERESDIL